MRESRRDHNQAKFLEAYAKTGKIGQSARACRISRDAVHDWRRNDPSFAAAFLVAKHQYKLRAASAAEESLRFFSSVVKPFVPREQWPHALRALVVASTTLRFKARETLTGITPPQQTTAAAPMLVIVEGKATQTGIGMRRHFFHHGA